MLNQTRFWHQYPSSTYVLCYPSMYINFFIYFENIKGLLILSKEPSDCRQSLQSDRLLRNLKFEACWNRETAAYTEIRKGSWVKQQRRNSSLSTAWNSDNNPGSIFLQQYFLLLEYFYLVWIKYRYPHKILRRPPYISRFYRVYHGSFFLRNFMWNGYI